ncbi:hypothetical protein ACJMK2_014711 [Sinanodonta woodiana]|uniref:lysoplasmalogenase n=1 Tax=Sinanodonta woodiana TaxID=1069815 RepID=A0ABD3V1I7_SINWO
MPLPSLFDAIHVALFVVSCISYILRYDLYEKNSPDTITSAYYNVFPVIILAAYVASLKHRYKNHPNEYTEQLDFVFLGLMTSSVGDVCLIFPETCFIPGILFFMTTQVFYSKGFGTHTASKLTQTVFITSYMMKMIFISYSHVLTVSGMRSSAKCERQPSIGAFCRYIGTILFIYSHSFIAFDKWVSPVPKC